MATMTNSKRTFSSREANQDFGRAKKASSEGPVMITDRGRPTHVLLNINEYRKIRGEFVSVADALAMEGGEDIEVDFPRIEGIPRDIDLS